MDTPKRTKLVSSLFLSIVILSAIISWPLNSPELEVKDFSYNYSTTENDSTVNFSAELIDNKIDNNLLKDSSARIELVLQDDSEQNFVTSTEGPPPFGVVKAYTNDNTTLYLWNDEYKDSDLVNTLYYPPHQALVGVRKDWEENRISRTYRIRPHSLRLSLNGLTKDYVEPGSYTINDTITYAHPEEEFEELDYYLEFTVE